jgi:hypothetical protein
MFIGCTKLTKAVLPAYELVEGCYNYMFNGCSSLNIIYAAFENTNLTATVDWVSGVAEIGTFGKSYNAQYDDAVRGNSTIPVG